MTNALINAHSGDSRAILVQENFQRGYMNYFVNILLRRSSDESTVSADKLNHPDIIMLIIPDPDPHS